MSKSRSIRIKKGIYRIPMEKIPKIKLIEPKDTMLFFLGSEKLLTKIGSWLFLIGILVAVIVGLIVGANLYTDANSYVTGFLAVLGFIVGLLSFFAMGSITREKLPTFLIAALALVGIGALSLTFTTYEWILAPYFLNIIRYIAIFAAPAAGLLAIRAIWDARKSEEIEKVIPKIPK